MNELLHPAASQHLPSFITAPGDTDVLMIVLSIILVLGILMFGSLFFRLHTLPERMAHKSQKMQFEIVAVLGLLALFTHIHLFWVAGLLLALIDIPDFGGSLERIAGSTEKLAGFGPGEGAVDLPNADCYGCRAPSASAGTTGSCSGNCADVTRGRSGRHKELIHA